MADNKAQELETILDINKAIFSTVETREIMYVIVKKLSEIILVKRCSIIFIDKVKNIAKVISTYEDPAFSNLPLNLGKYPEILKAIEEEKTILINDVEADPIVKDIKDDLVSKGIRSIMVIPIRYSEKDIGALYLRTSKGERRFTDKEVKVCQIVANMAAVALNNARLFNIIKDEKALLEKMAVTDDLTKLYNHRFFVKRLNEEFKRARRYTTTLSFIMIDIDNFKRINDSYGHQAGDVVLQEVSKVVKKCIRETDVLARYGGEEFAVILPHTGSEDAYKLADRIRTTIKGYRSNIVGVNGALTVSIGVATYPRPGVEDVDDLIRRADDGLYQAKGSGKDMVVCI